MGWTEVGEWLGYTVEDVTPGTYNINVSVASNGVAGMFFIQINGVNVSVVNVPASTGGWYNWVDLTIPDVEISSGEQFIRLQIVQGGFNIESITFESVLSNSNESLISNQFKLEKAYPFGKMILMIMIETVGVRHHTLLMETMQILLMQTLCLIMAT